MESFDDFGRFLKHLRREKNYTVRDLAKILSVTPSTVTYVENGRRKPFTRDVLDLIIRVMRLNEEESNMLFDLAGEGRGEVPEDIADYIIGKRYVYNAIRKAIKSNAGETEWTKFADIL